MKNTISLLTLLVMAVAPGRVSSQQPVNDTNTPLHLLKPNYQTPYGIPQIPAVKQDMDRVLSFLEDAMPMATENGRIKPGNLRLTSYECGVIYAAAQDAALRTGDQRYQRFAEDRLRFLADLAPKVSAQILKNPKSDPQMRQVVMPEALDDAGAMCAAMLRLSLTSPYPAYGPRIDSYMAWIARQDRMGADSIFSRERPHHHSVWLDDMYMGIPAMAWYACVRNDHNMMRQAVNQIRAFKSRMWMSDVKLFRHGWVEEMDPHPFFPWGRANGWALLTLCEVLDAMQASQARQKQSGREVYAGYDTDRAFVLDLLRLHLAGLAPLQDKTGFWHQLLNDPSTYLETSATAIYAYCMAHAICEGWVNAQTYGAQAILAWNAVATQINAKGHVENTCVGTGMGFDAAFYAYRPVHDMAAHGYGPTLWAGAEIIRLLQTTHPKMNDSAIHFYSSEQQTTEPIFSEQR
jgi:rhamnogalacturonyl hydrolase YesR